MLTPREIIAQAWTIATTETTLKQWGFFGSTLRLLLDIKLVSYQIYFFFAFLAGKEVGLFDDAILLHGLVSLPVFITIITLFLLLVIAELFIPSFTDGAIIGLTAKAHQKEKMTGGFVMALYNFFPVFTLHEIFVFSGVNLLITAVSIILRYGGGMKGFLIVIAVILWIFSSTLKFFASFAESAIVVKKANVFNAISESIKLVFSYPWHIIFILLLMLIISIRIFVNLAILIMIPGVVFGLGLLLTYVLTPAISYTIATIVALILIGIASYFFTYLHVFKQAVWTIMYMELIKEKDLDKIV
jgi:hypothetical protein